MPLLLQAAQGTVPIIVEGSSGFWETTWATFVGGAAAALISLGGVWLFERGRTRQVDRAAQRERRRLARNAAQSVLMELAAAARPLERVVGGYGAWEPMEVKRAAWDDQTNRAALNDKMKPEALADVDHAYHELDAIAAKLAYIDGEVLGSQFWTLLTAENWKLARRILETHIRPGIERLQTLIAGLELLDLADDGRLEAEAARIRAERAAGERPIAPGCDASRPTRGGSRHRDGRSG